jgi:hypothetical protein
LGGPYKTIAIYPNFADVGDAFLLLNKEGFTNDQISLLGREQEHWQEKLGHEWETLKTAKGAREGVALGAIPGLALVTGIALTGGVGLLVAGPMIAGMSALGMGALAGGLMGATATGNLDSADKIFNVEEEVADAISHGHWVIVVHSHTEVEAAHAQALLPNRRIVRQNESIPRGSSDLVAEQADIKKLGKIVEEAFESVAKVSTLPVQEVMCNFDEIDVAELKQAAQEAFKKISDATDLDTAQITAIFKANRGASMNDIVIRLREQIRINRAPW